MNRREFLAAMAGAAGLSAPVTPFAGGEMLGCAFITAELRVEGGEDGVWRHVWTETRHVLTEPAREGLE